MKTKKTGSGDFNVLLITLTNIGDIVLTTSLLSALKRHRGSVKIDMVLGPYADELFSDDNRIENLYVYDKYASLSQKAAIISELRKKKYDLIIDLRESAFPFFLRARKKIGVFCKAGRHIRHMHDKHLYKLKAAGIDISVDDMPHICISQETVGCARSILEAHSLYKEDGYISMAPGSKSNTKMWPAPYFADVAKRIFKELGLKTVLLGDGRDAAVSSLIEKDAGKCVVNLAGKTSLSQLAAIISGSKAIITNDSAPLHISTAVNTYAIALFGPTDPYKYGPLPEKGVFLREQLDCVPCEKARCTRENKLECLKAISPDEVFAEFKKFYSAYLSGYSNRISDIPVLPEDILIIRTDRLGDVLLSTPVFEAIKTMSPSSRVSVMVAPHAEPVVTGSPFVDEVIVYDKLKAHKGALQTLRFASEIRKRKFDAALILHSTNRSVLIPFLAGVPVRIGYGRRLGYLLNKNFGNMKKYGNMHEVDFNLFLLKEGFKTGDFSKPGLFFPLKTDAQLKCDNLLRKNSLVPGKYAVLHPGASCPSKLWPADKFCDLANLITDHLGYKVLIVGKDFPDEIKNAVGEVVSDSIVDLSDLLSLDELAWALKQAAVFISNDSGPVHLSTAVGTPCISIFGRKQPGLSPVRWAPYGKNDIFFHKDAGCRVCYAHECSNGFKCINLVSVEEVFAGLKKIIENKNI